MKIQIFFWDLRDPILQWDPDWFRSLLWSGSQFQICNSVVLQGVRTPGSHFFGSRPAPKTNSFSGLAMCRPPISFRRAHPCRLRAESVSKEFESNECEGSLVVFHPRVQTAEATWIWASIYDVGSENYLHRALLTVKHPWGLLQLSL